MDPRDFRSTLRSTVILPIVLVAFLATVLLMNNSFLARSFQSFERFERVSISSRQFIRLTLDVETGVRGYLLTGDQRFLRSSEEMEVPVHQTLDDLERLTAFSPLLRGDAQHLRTAFNDWQAWATPLIERRGHGSSASDVDNALLGKQLIDRVRAANETLLAHLETERRDRADHVNRLGRLTLLSLLGLSFVFAMIIAIVTHRRMSALVRSYDKHILEERRHRHETQDSRERLLTTLRSLAEAVFSTDADGRVTFMNPFAEQLTGTTLENARGEKLALHIVQEHTHEPVESSFDRVLKSGAPFQDSHTYLLRRPDGQFAYIERSAAPLTTSEGRFNGVVVVLRDVSERKRTEAALRSSDRLALLGRLSATIAHEIRNPLESVMNVLYLLKKPLPGFNTEDLVQNAEDELKRITQITQQLLSFNREAAEPVQIDVAELIDSALTLFGRKLETSNIRIQKDVEPHPSIFGLPGELRQVFTNLLANSIDAFKRGGTIRIHIRPAPSWRGSSGVVLTFADDGSGIPEEARRSLFTPFFTTKGEKGTGLGLWVSRGIVLKHRGTMRVRSRTGDDHGTTFTIFLPERYIPASVEERELRTA